MPVVDRDTMHQDQHIACGKTELLSCSHFELVDALVGQSFNELLARIRRLFYADAAVSIVKLV